MPNPAEARGLGISEDMTTYVAKGCNICNHTGYKGRFALYEYIAMDESMRRDMAACYYEPGGVERIMRQRGKSIMQNGVENILQGHTSVAEVIRAVFRE
jgi:general secretion pathway protein E